MCFFCYIGSNRNLLLNSINLFITNDTLANVITKLVFRGDVPTDVDDNAARIFRYNKSTKKIELVYKSETDSDGIVYETGYRSAITVMKIVKVFIWVDLGLSMLEY